MITIIFTCKTCGEEENISEEDDSKLEQRRCVPVCDPCYDIFLKKKTSLHKRVNKLHATYGIPHFNIGE